ncbi:MAG: GH3 auxin-responsive promoter family protein [Acidobacteriota bacterium]
MTGPAGFFLNRVLARRYRTLCGALARPMEAQRATLQRLVSRAAGTEWGRRHRLGELRQGDDLIASFRERVPLTTHADLEPAISRMRQGEADVLWPGVIRTFAVSSGTTGSRKQMPMSDEMLGHMGRFGAAIPAARAARTGSAGFAAGMVISLVGAVQTEPADPRVRFGELSGLLADHWARSHPWLRRLAARRRVPDRLRRIGDLFEQLDAIAAVAVRRDVRMLAMAPSWALVFLERAMAQYNRLHHAHVGSVGEIWPHLGLLVSNAVPLRPYLASLRELIGLEAMAYQETYVASEAALAFQADAEDPAMTFHPDCGAFVEFVSLADLHRPRPVRHTLAEVRPGVSYVPYVSTCSGLWACEVGDIVQFDGRIPARLRLVGRTAEVLDSYGERLLGSDVRTAVRQAAAEAGLGVLAFHVVPRPARDGHPHHHEWLVEFPGGSPHTARLASALDDTLQEINADYRTSRRRRGLGPPVVIPLPPGLFYRSMRDIDPVVCAQAKVPVLSEQRELADRVLGLLAGRYAGSDPGRPDGRA